LEKEAVIRKMSEKAQNTNEKSTPKSYFYLK